MHIDAPPSQYFPLNVFREAMIAYLGLDATSVTGDWKQMTEDEGANREVVMRHRERLLLQKPE